MDYLTQIEEILLGLSELITSPHSSIYWLYLTSTLLLALLICLARGPKGNRIPGLIRSCLPGRIYLGGDLRRDIGMLFLNTLLYSFFMAPFLLSSGSVANLTWWSFDATLGPVTTPVQDTGARITLTVAILLAADLGFFVSHWLQHKIPLLWEFHKVHHSAQTLNPLTAFRRHPVDIAIEGTISGLFTGMAFGTFDYLSGGSLDMITLMGVNAGLFVFLLFGAHLQHSHLWISYGRLFNRILVSPAMHHIHHSKDPRHFDRNLGNIFSFWDAIVGTQYLPARHGQLEFGLKDGEEINYNSIARLYLVPFSKLRRTGRGVLNHTPGAFDLSSTAKNNGQ